MKRLPAILVAIGAMAVGAVGSGWYALKYSEEQYGRLGMEQFYKESAQEIVIYTTLLRFMRNGEHERAMKLLEGLAKGAETTRNAISGNVPEATRLKVDAEAADRLRRHRSSSPPEARNAP